MNTFEKLGEILKPHAVLTSMGIPSERALQIVTNRNLSFTPKYMSLTETYRAQLKSIAHSVDVNINAMLRMLTTDQLAEVLEQHKHFQWSHPSEPMVMTLNGIRIDSNTSKWMLSFESSDVYLNQYQSEHALHDLEIQDVLSLLATVENVMEHNTIPA